MPGPPRRPLALALATGSRSSVHRAKVRAARAPKPPPTSGRPPTVLRSNPVALATWRAEAPTQIALGTLTKGSRLAFTLFCEAVADYRAARAVIQVQGLVYEARQGTLARPEVGMLGDARRTLLAFLREFGMTPAALSRVTSEAPDADSDELAAFRKAHPPQRA